MDVKPADLAAEERITILQDGTAINAVFNIMPNSSVTETFYVREFEIGPRWIKATFHRSYVSAMTASPSHVTMTVLPLLAQRAGYLLLCHEFGLPLDLESNERLKMWPSRLELIYPQLLREETDLVYLMKLVSLERRSQSRLQWIIESTLNDSLCLNAGGTAIFLE